MWVLSNIDNVQKSAKLVQDKRTKERKNMRQYEVGVILHPDLEIDIENAVGKVESTITGIGGKIESKDNWGKRKLAYRIKKQDWGIYVFFQVEIDPKNVQQLDNALRISTEVIRYIVVSLEDVRTVNKGSKKRNKPAEKSEIE
jgi:small subunit ribosomal protein S6